MPKTTKHVYVYHDMDHDECEVFSSMPKAKAYAEEQWGEELEWDEDEDGAITGSYVSIYKRQVR